MSLAFRAEALTLGSLFSGDRTFAVPVFQRAFSWTSREVGQLLGDIWLALEQMRRTEGPYNGLLLGSLVVVEEPGRKSAWVIDGKQRLTTLTVILATLRDRLGLRAAWISNLLWSSDPANGAHEASPRLVLDIEEDAYFAAQVRRFGASDDPIEPDGDHKGRLRLRECQQTVFDDLEERSDAELLALAAFLRDQVALVLISAPDIDTGFRTFVTTNHRGKPLTTTDILKAELMAQVPEQTRDERLDQWANAERTLGGDFQELPGYLRAVHGRAQSGTIRDVLDLSQREGGAVQFLDTLLFPLADRLHPILNASYAGSRAAERINTSLRYLKWLKARDWVPPALAFCGRFPDRDAEFAVFLDGLERLAYGMQILGTGNDRRGVRYRAVIAALGDHAKPNVLPASLLLSEEEQGTIQLNARSNLYQRSQSTCKLLLKRLSASYAGDTYLPSLSEWTVEHLLPRNISAESPWRQAIPNAEEREACSKMLGNLVLITKQQNKEARNNGFEVKHRVIFPHGQVSPHAITNQVLFMRHWTAEDIRARDAVLLQRVAEIWQLKGQPRARRSKQSALAANA